MAMAFGGQGLSHKGHRPVLLRETIESLAVERGGLFVDCTVGLGGHSEAILQTSPDAQVLGIDRDEEALRLARERLAEFGGRFRAVRADFRELTRVLATAEVKAVRGILADLGVSSLQLDSPRADSVSGTKRHSTCVWICRAAKRRQSCSVVFLK